MPSCAQPTATLDEQQDDGVGQRQRQRGGAALRKGARQMRLHRQVIIAEQQIGEERGFGEDGEDHRPPAAGAGVDGADRQAAVSGAMRSAIGAAPRFRPARASGHSQARIAARGRRPRRNAPATTSAPARPTNSAVMASARSSGTSVSPGIFRMTLGCGIQRRGAQRLAAMIQHQAGMRDGCGLAVLAAAGLPTADGGWRPSG